MVGSSNTNTASPAPAAISLASFRRCASPPKAPAWLAEREVAQAQIVQRAVACTLRMSTVTAKRLIHAHRHQLRQGGVSRPSLVVR